MKKWYMIALSIFLMHSIVAMMPPAKSKPIESENLMLLLLQALNFNNCIRAAWLINQLDPEIHCINARDLNDNTAIHLLARQPNKLEDLAVRLLQKLRNKGANIDLRNANDDTPLLSAVHAGNLRFAYWLMAYDADHLWSNKQSITALHLLCSNQELIRRMNECLHRCNKKRTPDAILGCRKSILSNFWLLATSSRCRSFIPSLYNLCLKALGSGDTDYLERYLPQLQNMVVREESIVCKTKKGIELKPLVPLEIAQRSAEQVAIDITVAHIRSPVSDNNDPMPLVSLLPTHCLQPLYREITTEESIRTLPINWTDASGFTALAHLARSGACFDIMQYMISLGAGRMEADSEGNLPHKLLCFVKCCCDHRVSYPRVEELLRRPERIAREIARLAQLRKLAETEEATPVEITPRSTLTSPSPRV